MARKLLLAGIISFLSFDLANAACRLSPMDQKYLAYLKSSASNSKGSTGYNRGLTLIGAGCHSEAIQAFSGAEAELRTVPSPTLKQNDLLGLIRAARALAEALQTAERGDRKAAVSLIMRSVIAGPESAVKRGALQHLALLLDPRAPEWEQILDDLNLLAGRGDWRMRRALNDHLISIGSAAQAVDQLEAALRSEERLETSLALRILLADAYRRTGRTVEATLMAGKLDAEVGEKVLDWELRLEYLRLGAELARSRVRENVAGAREELQRFEQAMREVQP